MGTAVYYKTNKGDYVYFNHLSIGEYLFPIEAFCAYQRAILDEALQYPDRVGSVSYSQVWDLSPYDFKADTFNLHAEIPEGISGDLDATHYNDSGFRQWGVLLGMFAVGILAAVSFTLHLYKKRAK